jgi:hypothetical protein
MKIFLIALIIRLAVWFVFETAYGEASFPAFDSYEYYNNAEALEVWPPAGERFNYNNWYERTPAYVLFLYLIDRVLLLQVIISAFGVVLMYRMNRLAGWIWCLYPMDIIHSFQYMKETLLIFLIIAVIYAFKRRDYISYDNADNAAVR